VTPLLDERLATYAEAHTTARPPLFEELRAATRAHSEAHEMQVGVVEGALLKLLCASLGARRVLEIGTFTGWSALCMAEALPEGGRLVTCDRDPAATALARSFFDRSEHGAKIEIRLGDALETVRSLAGGERFDLAFIDADKSRYLPYFEAILPLLRVGGLLVADNTLWSGRVLDPRSEDDRGIVAFNDALVADRRVEVVQLPVRDGVTVARKLAA
jgi:caffeoyl-CoA O-methyltransferase